MNIGVVTSFAIGGLLLLSILHMNMTVSNNSMHTTQQLISKNKMQTVVDVISADIQRMGHGVAASDPIINSIGQDRISFQAQINGQMREIVWDFRESEPYTASPNPDDYKLVRKDISASGNVETLTYPAISFELDYFDTNHSQTNTISEVDQIEITFVSESANKLPQDGGEELYARSFWEKTFVPPSLHIRNISR